MVSNMEINDTVAYRGMPIVPGALFFLESRTKRTAGKQPDEDLLESVVLKRAILCRLCRVIITSSERKISQAGKYEHTFVNPQGVVFTIGCYSAAPGTTVFGTPSREFSWFQGYSWRFAACSNCQEHLGWYFEKTAKEGFWGLIVNKLIEEEPE